MLLEVNALWRSAGEAQVLLETTKALGFDGAAFVTYIDDAAKLKEVKAPATMKRLVERLDLDSISKPNGAGLVLRRLHIDVSCLAALTNLHTYMKQRRTDWDFVSAKVTDEATWLKLLTLPQLLVDIVQLEWYETSPPIRPSRSQLKMFETQGMYLEICLDKLLLSPVSVAAAFMRNVKLVCRHMPKSHILISTGAASSLYLRGPRDLLALAATLFGSAAAHRIVYVNPTEALERARTRRQVAVCGHLVQS